MPKISRAARVTCTPEQMFELVNDVESYSRYLPMCESVKVLARTPTSVTATVTLTKAKLRLSFTTINTIIDQRNIHMNLVDGPFKTLKGAWRFERTDDGGCLTTFDLQFEFDNRILATVFGAFVKELGHSLVEAFSQQAAIRYGNVRFQPG